MDETTIVPKAVPAEPVAPAVTEALATDTAAPTAGEPGEDPAPTTTSDTTQAVADPQPGADPIDDTPSQDEPVEHPVLTAVRDELSKIANMPAHIWNAVEEAFERVAAKL
jgi:hypothetical protein